MKTLALLDSNAIVHRAYHALPKNLSNSKGEMTNVTYGFALALIKVLEELKPDYIAAAFDVAAPTLRKLEYAEYKAKRVKADQELYDQIPRVYEMLEAFGIPVYTKEGYEADDIIGTIVERCLTAEIRNPKSETRNNRKLNSNFEIRDSDLLIYIVSGDKDVFQLLNGHVKAYMLKQGFRDGDIVDAKVVKEKYNLDPHDFIDLKALAGDPSDNIPGVPGVGPKTATELIQRFDTMEKLYEKIASLLHCSIDELTMKQWDNETVGAASDQLDVKPRILKLLIENKDLAFQSHRLATIERNAPVDFDLAECKWGQYDKERLRKLFEELEFKSLLVRFTKQSEDKEQTTDNRRQGTNDGGRAADDKRQITPEQKKKDEQLRLEL